MDVKIGIISDTHDNLGKTKKAVELFRNQGVDTVIHCGDMIAPFTAELFDADFDFYAVRGNNDGEWDLKSTIEEFGTWMGNIGEIELDEVSIGVYHGTNEEIVKGLVKNGYDYLFRGHTHKTKIKKHGETTEINPGGIKIPGQEESFHIAIFNMEKDEIKLHRVD